MSMYFSKSCDLFLMTLLAPGKEHHLGFSPKSCTYPTLVIIDPLGVKIVSIYFIKIITVQHYSALLPLTIAHFLLLLKKNVLCICIFSKRVSDI